MKTVWIEQGSNYFLGETSSQRAKLEPAIYKIEMHPMKGLYLKKVMRNFEFPYKIYDIQDKFVNRVKKSWDNTTSNMGVLLNGIKGTGKTVTAEMIANKMDLPVILISEKMDGLVSFLNDIQQDVVVFIDEFEKTFNNYDNSLLPIMDGAMNSKHRIMFLLTTNETSIDRNMLQRPSRIRYVKTFSDLSLDVITEVVDDMLVHKEHKESTVKMISELPIITMDLVKSVIQEVNIHDESPYNFREIFNVHGDKKEIYNIYRLEKSGLRTLIYENASINISFNQHCVGDSIYLNHGPYIGRVMHFLNPSMLEVLPAKKEDDDDDDDDYVRKKPAKRTKLSLKEIAEEKKSVDTNQNEYWIFEKAYQTHYMFNSVVF